MKNYLDKEYDFFNDLPRDIFIWPETIDYEANWQKMYGLVREYIDKFNKLPSNGSKNPYEKKLAKWCAGQRNNYRNPGVDGRRNLTAPQIKLLESLKGWFWQLDLAKQWMQMYESVKDYNDKYNRLPANGSEDPYEKKLARWCSTQRDKYKSPGVRRNRLLTETQIKLLEKLQAWYWQQDLDAQWLQMYELVKEYIDRFNELPPLESKDPFVKKSANWCATQRKNYRNPGIGNSRPLNVTQITLLENIKAWYWHK